MMFRVLFCIAVVAALRKSKSKKSASASKAITPGTTNPYGSMTLVGLCPAMSMSGDIQYAKVTTSGDVTCVTQPITVNTCPGAAWSRQKCNGSTDCLSGRTYWTCTSNTDSAVYSYFNYCIEGQLYVPTNFSYANLMDDGYCAQAPYDLYSTAKTTTFPVRKTFVTSSVDKPEHFTASIGSFTAVSPFMLFTVQFPTTDDITYLCYETAQKYLESSQCDDTCTMTTLPGSCYKLTSLNHVKKKKGCDGGTTAGTYAATQQTCFNCPLGFYCPKSTKISVTDTSYFATYGSTTSLTEIQCPAGYYCKTSTEKSKCSGKKTSPPMSVSSDACV